MAIYNENEIKHGVSLPYIRIEGVTCTKKSTSVSIGYSASKENVSICQSPISLSPEHSAKIGDEIIEMVYFRLKELGYLSGEDV